MTEPIHLGDLTREMCRRLGVEPRVVSSIRITPGRAVLGVYQLDDNDQPAIANGEPIVELLTFTITTERAKRT